MSNLTSQIFESYVPVYDSVPEKWEEARQFLVEHLKKISNAVNVREIGWMLDEELITGKQFIPGVNDNQQFRTVLRKVVDFSPLAIGTTSLAHGVVVDANFSLINLFASATNAGALTGNPINQPNITYDATNINVTSAAAYTRCYAVFEYITEL